MPDIGRFLPGRPTAWLIPGLLLVSIAGIVWLLVPRNGLTARYYETPRWSGSPAYEATEALRAADAFLSRAEILFPDQPFSATWRGMLLVEQPGAYTFTLASDDGSWLLLDGRPIVDNGGVHEFRSVEATVHLDPGVHPVEIRYFDAGGGRALSLRWAFGSGRFEAIPGRLLFPTRGAYLVRNVVYGYVAPLLVAASLLALPLTWGIGRVVRDVRAHPDQRGTNVALVVALAIVPALALPVVGWGLPYAISWAPDEIPVGDVLDALDRGFSGGWYRPYPPLHYYTLGLVALPFEIADRAGLGSALAGNTHTTLIVLFRLVSVVMALGVAYVVFLTATTIQGDRMAGVCSALLVASMPLFVFYAGLGNLDVPYVFWFALALFFYVRFTKNPRGGDLTGFAVAGSLSICTKDQAYGFFILPALHALWLRYRVSDASGPGALLRDPGLARAVAGAAAAFVLGQNLVLNAEGFERHVAHVLEMSTYTPAYDLTVVGQMQMMREAIEQIGWSMGWPSLAAGIVGLVVMMRGQRRQALGLILVLVSYYVFFLAVVRYQFDRFFLAVCVVLALGGGWTLAWLFRERRSAPAWRLTGAAVVFTSLAYGALIPLKVSSDSRYVAESWLAAEVGAGESVAYVGRRTYLPRLRHGAFRLPESWSEIRRYRPDVLVVNAEYSCRAPAGTARREFYDRLNADDNGLYRLALRHRSDPWWPVRGPDAVFRSPCENSSTNLSKISPEIRIYRLIAASQMLDSS